MGRRRTEVLATVRLRVEPADQAWLQCDVAALAAFADQASVEPAQGDHDAVWVVMRACLLPRVVPVFEHPYALVLEDYIVRVGIGLRAISHDLLPLASAALGVLPMCLEQRSGRSLSGSAGCG